MEPIHVRQIEDEWAAFVGDRQVTKRACKGCITKMMLKMTAKSNRYNQIIVYNSDGSTTIHRTGVGDDRNTEATRQS